MAAAALAFLAALLLAPGQARAANECVGAISTTNPSRTCTSTTYANGIIYLNVNPGTTAVATVIVPGAATAWAVTSGTGTTFAGNGITLDSDEPASASAAGGGLALTVGGASATNNQVAITQRSGASGSGNYNNGIYINQQRRGAATTTVTVNAGVTIGAAGAANRMLSNGIRANIWLGTGAATFTNAATIHSALDGIFLNRGDSADTNDATTITNTGAITAGNHAIHLRYLAGDTTGGGGNTAAVTTGDAKITNSGVLTKHTGTGSVGAIELDYARGHGDAEVDNSGAITATASGVTQGYGIRLRYANMAGNSASGDATIKNSATIASKEHALVLENSGVGGSRIENSGALTVDNAGENGIRLIDQGSTSTAATETATVISSGDITSTSLGINVVVRNKNTAGDNVGVSITHSAGDIDVSASGGIKAAIGDNNDTAGANSGDAVIRVTGGSVESRDTILEVANWQSGDSSIEVSEGVTLTSTAEHGIFVNKASANTVGGVTVTNAGTITGPKSGIYVRRSAVTGAGDISVTNSGDIVKSGGVVDWDGILVEDLGRGDVTVTNSGDIGASGAMHERGIRVAKLAGSTNNGGISGDIAITNTGAVFAETHGILVEDPAGHMGSVTVSNGGDVTAERPIWVNRLGSGAVTVTNTGGNVRGSLEAGIFAVGSGAVTVTNTGGNVVGSLEAGILARNKPGDASTVTVSVRDGTVQSTGQSKPAIHARNRGTGDVTVTIAASEGDTEATPTLISRHNAGVFAPLGSYENGQVKITQSGTILGRKGIYAQVAHHTDTDASAMRAAGAPADVIDITWTGAFGAGTTAQTAPNDNERFVAATAARLVAIDQEVAAGKAVLQYGAPAGIEAQVMSWREVMRTVAEGDAPAAVAADLSAQGMLVPASATAADNDYVGQFKAALANPDIEVSAAVLTAIGSTATTAAGVTDAEIVNYFRTTDTNEARTLLRNVLAQGLSEKEEAVLVAVATGESAALTAALDDADAGFSNDYKTAVRDLLKRYNVGNINIAMNGGSIDSRGDGIRAYYATPNDNNGAIDVTVAAGTTVTGANAGIWVANAGLDTGADADSNADDILKQTVTVHGMVTGGTDAAVHLVGGGTLTVGEMGVVHAGSSGVAIKVNDPGRSVITIDGEVTGNPGEGRAVVELAGGGTLTVGQMGSVMAAEGAAGRAVKATRGAVRTVIYAAALNSQDDFNKAVARGLGGGIDGSVTDEDGGGNQVTVRVTDAAGVGETVPFDSDTGVLNPRGNPNIAMLDRCNAPQVPTADGSGCEDPPPPSPPPPPMTMVPGNDGDGSQLPPAPQRPPMLRTVCDDAHDNCRLYEALPSTLLAMNGLPTYADRTSAARDARGGWARVEVAHGKWKAETSTQPDVAYDHRRHGVRAGMDFAVMGGDAGRVGVSVHGLRGSAEMAGVGEIDLSGAGVGVHVTRAFDGGMHVDAQAAVTWYHADLKSTHPAIVELMDGDTTLKNDVNGHGYALGVEVGQALTMDGGVTVTPRAGLTWSKADLDDFTDEARRQVSVKDAQSLKGRAGVGVERVLDRAGMDGGSRVFASLDVEQEFKEETEAGVYGSSPLKASARKTRLRTALGAAHVWGDGRYALQGTLGYTVGGGGNRDFGGGLSFAMRF